MHSLFCYVISQVRVRELRLEKGYEFEKKFVTEEWATQLLNKQY